MDDVDGEWLGLRSNVVRTELVVNLPTCVYKLYMIWVNITFLLAHFYSNGKTSLEVIIQKKGSRFKFGRFAIVILILYIISNDRVWITTDSNRTL